MSTNTKLHIQDESISRYKNIKLVDVMRAVHKLRLQNRVSPSCFAFLFGLLMEANEKKFPKVMQLYPADEIGIGGGGTRQTICNNRNRISELRIDNEPLLDINLVRKGRSSYTEYSINFPLLVKQIRLWKKTNTIIHNSIKPSYQEYLQTPEWKERRRKAIISAQWRCQLCYRNDLPLHVHHKTYERIGHEDPGDLTVLCSNCHAKFHDKLPDPHKEGRAAE